METLVKIISSRTNQTIALMFILNGLQAIQPELSGTALIIVNLALSLLAVYFRSNPTVNFNVTKPTTLIE
jgi:hypothetical protein